MGDINSSFGFSLRKKTLFFFLEWEAQHYSESTRITRPQFFLSTLASTQVLDPELESCSVELQQLLLFRRRPAAAADASSSSSDDSISTGYSQAYLLSAFTHQVLKY